MLGSGPITKCMAKGCSLGWMGDLMKVTILKIRSKEVDCLNGKILELYFRNRPNGQQYLGEWYDGKQHGRGILIFADGKRREGEWRDGRRIRWTSEEKH